MLNDRLKQDSSKTRILFVDDEPQVLKVLQITLRSMGADWEMVFVESGEQALARMEQSRFDIVVSDMCMPGISGAQLLNAVMQRYPRTIRLILSGYADEELVMQCVGATHQYLMKPCNLAALRATLKRIGHLKNRLTNEELQTLVAKMTNFPSVPKVYFQIIEALQSPSSSIQRIADIVSTDPALTVKLLQLVNSAFFGFASSVSDAGEAVQLLGVGRVRSLALTIHLFSAYDPATLKQVGIERIWDHSLNTGLLARKLAAIEAQDETVMEQAFTAGLLHDAGKLILAANLSDAYHSVLGQAQQQKCPLVQAENAAFHANHADVGAYLLDLWGLPMPLIEAVALHHEPDKTADSTFSPLTAVHVANALIQSNEESSAWDRPAHGLNLEYLSRLGLQDRIETWKKELIR